MLGSGALFTCFYLSILKELGLASYDGAYVPGLHNKSRGSVKVLTDLGYSSDADMRMIIEDRQPGPLRRSARLRGPIQRLELSAVGRTTPLEHQPVGLISSCQ